ncbi:MAG: hypothetical protein OEY64_01295 [Nitrospinota bacterium]|nr:hypothetical protein [Nitrospinota bacterium]
MINLGDLTPSLLKAVLKASLPEIEQSIEKSFTKGELVQGKVVRVLGKDGALVKLKNMELVAKTEKPLVAGESILVRVDKVKPYLNVSLLPNSTPMQEKAASLLRLYLPQAKPAGTLLADLVRAVARLPREALKGTGLEEVLQKIFSAANVPEKSSGLLSELLAPLREKGTQGKEKGGDEKNILKLLGLSHEAEMAEGKPTRNLKRSLLILQKNLETLSVKDPESYKEPLAKVQQTIRNIELRQLMNLDEAKPEKSVDLPLWNGQEMSTAKIYVKRDGGEKEGKKQGGKSEITVSVIVEMSRLGVVRGEVKVRPGTAGEKAPLSAAIYVQDAGSARVMEDELPTLKDALSALGYEPDLSVKVAKVSFLREDLERDIGLPVDRLLNVKA